MYVYWVTSLNGEKDGIHDSSWFIYTGRGSFQTTIGGDKSPSWLERTPWQEIEAASHIATIIRKWRIDRMGRKTKKTQGPFSGTHFSQQGCTSRSVSR